MARLVEGLGKSINQVSKKQPPGNEEAEYSSTFLGLAVRGNFARKRIPVGWVCEVTACDHLSTFDDKTPPVMGIGVFLPAGSANGVGEIVGIASVTAADQVPV